MLYSLLYDWPLAITTPSSSLPQEGSTYFSSAVLLLPISCTLKLMDG